MLKKLIILATAALALAAGSGNVTLDACATLGAFISEVNAQTDKKISTAQAASFIAQAHSIEAALGC